MILPVANVADHRGLVGVFFGDFAISAAKLPQIIKDNLGLKIEAWNPCPFFNEARCEDSARWEMDARSSGEGSSSIILVAGLGRLTLNTLNQKTQA